MDGLAVYAAVVSTVALAWQVVTQVRARRPRLRISGLIMFFVGSTDDAEALAHAGHVGEWPDGMEFRVQADVVNTGESAVLIDRVEFKQRVRGGLRTWVATPSDGGGRLSLEPGDSRQFVLLDSALDGFDPGGFVIAQVVLASGKNFSSREFGRPVPDSTLVTMTDAVMKELSRAIDPARLYIHEVTLPEPSTAEGDHNKG